MTNHRAMGWRPEPPDVRDLSYRSIPGAPRASRLRAAFRPRVVDLTKERPELWPAIFDQGAIGSCVAQAWVAAAGFVDALFNDAAPDPLVLSRLALYRLMRELQGWGNEDSGAYIRDGAKAIVRWGLCQEDRWPYRVERFREWPPEIAMLEGAHRREGLVYARVEGEGEILDCLAEGFPVAFGSTLYPSFQRVTYANPVVPMPGRGERPDGGHAMLLCGYDRRCGRKTYKVRNSWSTAWGRDGYHYMPFEYIHNRNITDDLWTLRRIAA